MLFAFHRSIHDSLRNPRRNTLVLQFVVFCLRFRWSQVLFCAALLDLTSGIKERELPHQHVRIDIFSWSALVASAVYRHANVSADVCQCSARMRCCVLRRFSVENQSFSNWLGTIVPFLWNQFFAPFFGTSRPLVLKALVRTLRTNLIICRNHPRLNINQNEPVQEVHKCRQRGRWVGTNKLSTSERSMQRWAEMHAEQRHAQKQHAKKTLCQQSVSQQLVSQQPWVSSQRVSSQCTASSKRSNPRSCCCCCLTIVRQREDCKKVLLAPQCQVFWYQKSVCRCLPMSENVLWRFTSVCGGKNVAQQQAHHSNIKRR